MSWLKVHSHEIVFMAGPRVQAGPWWTTPPWIFIRFSVDMFSISSLLCIKVSWLCRVINLLCFLRGSQTAFHRGWLQLSAFSILGAWRLYNELVIVTLLVGVKCWLTVVFACSPPMINNIYHLFIFFIFLLTICRSLEKQFRIFFYEFFFFFELFALLLF